MIRNTQVIRVTGFLSRRFASISAALVKDLREKSGAPMMDCKNALSSPEVNGDITKAMDWLRAKGKSRAINNADRQALEGVVGLYHCKLGNKFGIVEVNSETDFVSRNVDFHALVATIARTSIHFPEGDIAVPDLLKSKAIDLNGNPCESTLQDTLTDAINNIR